VIALPDLRATAAEAGGHYATLGVSWRSLLLAVLGGVVITLLTRMQHASDDLGPKRVAGIAMPFVLVAAQLFHSVLDSILMFTGLLGGQASYTWASWAQALAWSALGNLIGGIGLVTHPVAAGPAPGGGRTRLTALTHRSSQCSPPSCPAVR